MAISLIDSNTGSDTTGDFTVTRPAGGTPANGDYIVVIVGVEDDSPLVGSPGSPWVTADQVAGTSGNDTQISIFYKKITDVASEASSYTFTAGVNDDKSWWAGTLRGVHATTPEDEAMSGNATYQDGATSPVAGTITTVTSGAYVLGGYQVNSDTAVSMPGGSWSTLANNISSGGSNISVIAQRFAAIGATGDATATNVAASQATAAGQWAFRPSPATISGTITASVTEADIVAGGKTLIITLVNDTWIAAGAGSFDLQRDEIIAGITSAQSEALGWNLVPKALQSLGGVVRTSDTVVTITWDAFATYNITAQETITVTVPATAVTSATSSIATPTFTVDTAGGTRVKDIIGSGIVPSAR